MAIPKFTCDTCRFYSPLEFLGHCKRYPHFEQKSKHEWCGEYYSAQEDAEISAAIEQVAEPADQPKKRGRPAKVAL